MLTSFQYFPDSKPALMAAVFNKATEKMTLDSETDKTLKGVFTKQVLALISSKCQNQKVRTTTAPKY